VNIEARETQDARLISRSTDLFGLSGLSGLSRSFRLSGLSCWPDQKPNQFADTYHSPPVRSLANSCLDASNSNLAPLPLRGYGIWAIVPCSVFSMEALRHGVDSAWTVHADSFHADGGSRQRPGKRAEGGYHGAVVADCAPVHDSAIRGGHQESRGI
jgi:hypothetical protein